MAKKPWKPEDERQRELTDRKEFVAELAVEFLATLDAIPTVDQVDQAVEAALHLVKKIETVAPLVLDEDAGASE